VTPVEAGEGLLDEQVHAYYLQPCEAREQRMICMNLAVPSFYHRGISLKRTKSGSEVRWRIQRNWHVPSRAGSFLRERGPLISSFHFNDVWGWMCSGSCPKVPARIPASTAPARPLALPCADLCEAPTPNFQVELTSTPGGSASAIVSERDREWVLSESAASDHA